MGNQCDAPFSVVYSSRMKPSNAEPVLLSTDMIMDEAGHDVSTARIWMHAWEGEGKIRSRKEAVHID